MTLFEKYGGFATVNKIVRQFYLDVLTSSLLSPYFEDVDMERLIDHQTKFISHALGGPAEYTGRSLEVSHDGLNISLEAFNEVAEILRENLEDAGMETSDVASVMEIVGSVQSSIVRQD